jgi:alpha-tubulin suppressor-like RCC1 family protein
MAKVWYQFLLGFLVLVLSGCGLFNQPVQEDNPQNPNLTLQVSTLNVSGQTGTFVLVPIDLESKMASPVVYAKLILNYDPSALEYAGVYANTDHDAQVNAEGNAGRLSLELFGTYKNLAHSDHVAFKILNTQASRVQFHLIEAATQNGEHRNFADVNGLNQQTQVAESRVNIGAGGYSKLPTAIQDQEADTTVRAIPISLQVPAKLEAAWAGVEMGDLNGDKTISKSDWELLLKALLGQVVLTPVQRYASDLRGDNIIDVIDFAYLLAKQLNIQYAQGSSASPSVVVHADTEVVPGNAALVLIGNPLSLAPAINTKYTFANTANWITDPISSTGSSTNAYSILASIETAVEKPTTLQVRSAQAFKYRVDTGTERKILTIAAPVGTATSISVVPGAVLFTGVNQTKTFRVVAYDANRRQVLVNPTEFSWVVNDPNQVSLTNNNNGTVTVTSKTAVGSAFVSARTTNGALIANPAAITIATPKPDVVILPDSAVLFPPVNSINVTTVASINANGVASFTGDELAAYLEAPTPFTAKYPVVLRGTAPTVGSLVVSGEGSSIFGRVLQTQTRGAYSLVQLQLVPFPEAFSALELKANSRDLQAQGLLPKTLALKQSSTNITNGRTTRAGANSPLKIGNCTITGGFTLGSVKAEGELVVDPFFEFTGGNVTNSLKVKIGADVKISLLATLVLSPTLTAKAECPLIDPLNIDIPLSGPFYKLLTGRISNQPYFEAELRGQGGGSVTLTYKPEFVARIGFELQINNGNPQFTNLWDTSKSTNDPPSIILSQPSFNKIPVKLYGSAFLNMRADVGIQIAALFTDISDYIPPSAFREKLEGLRSALFVKFLRLKGGPKVGIGWGNEAYTLQQRIPGTGAEINGVVEGELGFKQLEEFAATFLGKAIPLTFPLKFNAVKFPFYNGVKPDKLFVNNQEVIQKVNDANQHPPIEIKRNTTVELTVEPVGAVGDEFSDVVNGIPDALKSNNEISLFTKSVNGIYDPVTKPFTVTPGIIPNSVKISIPSATLCEFFTDPIAIYVVYTNKLLNLIDAPSLAGSFQIQCEADPEAKIEFSEKTYALGAKPNGSQTRKLLIKNIGSKDLKLRVRADTKNISDIDWLRLEGDLIIIEQDLPVGKITEVAFVAKCRGSVETLNGVIQVAASSKDLDFPASGNGDASVELACNNTGQPAPPPPGGDPGGGSGEPHIASFDGAYYDFQGAGEYIYAKSKVDSFQAQVRFTKFGSYLSVNQSFALNVNGDRVGIYGNKLGGTESYDILVNGVKQTFASDGSFYLELPNGGKITASHVRSGSSEGEFVDVRWADGYGFTANSPLPLKPFLGPGQYIWLSATVYIPADKRGLVQGLLGNDNQDPQDDFELRDGTKLVFKPGSQVLYGKFGARGLGWRISQSESLFDYEPGTNTDTFTDINYPTKVYGISDIPLVDYEIAKAICQTAGIVDPQSLDNCILDYYLTGDPAFVRVAKRLDPIAPSISINPPALTLGTGSSYPFSASVKGVTDPTVTWSTTGGSVSSLGVYTAPSTVGTYTVIAISLENPNLRVEVVVRVVDPIVPAISISPPTLTINAGNSYQFSANVKGVTDSTVTWSTTGGSISSLGVYTAPSTAGSYTVSATSLENPNLSFTVSVRVNANTTVNLNIPNIRVAAGFGHSSAAFTSFIAAWGANDYGQLGIGNTTPQNRYVNVSNLGYSQGVAQLSNGSNFSLALTYFGNTSQVYSWGRNDRGQLGLGDAIDRSTPTLIPVLNNINVVGISGQFDHNLALTQTGQVYAWGANYNGQLGLGDAGTNQGSDKDRNVPTLIPNLNNIVSISAGYNISVALNSSGQVYTWGRNDYGQLGLGDNNYRVIPTLVPNLSNVTYVVAIAGRCYAITQSGQIYAWGYNASAELGLGNTANQSTPQLVLGLSNVVEFGGDSSGTLALTNTGEVYAFGGNYYGELGLGDSTNRSTPSVIPNFNARLISICTCNHIVAIDKVGAYYSWGSNNSGQLGLGDTINRTSPTSIPISGGVARNPLTPPLR